MRWDYTSKTRNELTVRNGDEVEILKLGNEENLWMVHVINSTYYPILFYRCLYTVHAKLKFLFAYRSTLRNIIMEGTLEPCYLRLVLSTSPITLALVAVNITKTILLDLLITLDEGDKALKCIP